MSNYDVVIVNYNGESIISSCLESIYNSSLKPRAVIIYDNASSDSSKSVIRKKFPKVILLDGKTNLGFGMGNNNAMKHSKSKYILFMNNDLLLDKNCAETLLKSISADENIAIINPLIFKGWQKKSGQEVYSFGATMNQSAFGYSLYDSVENRTDLTCFSGACFMALASEVKRLQFEKSFFLYYEEPDLSAKLLMRGLKIARNSQAKSFHLENYSSPKLNSQGICFRQFYAIQNRWFVLGKYFPTKDFLKALPLNILHLLYNMAFFIKCGRFNYLKLIFLSSSSFRRGRKMFDKTANYSWIKKLDQSGIGLLLSLKKRVYY